MLYFHFYKYAIVFFIIIECNKDYYKTDFPFTFFLWINLNQYIVLSNVKFTFDIVWLNIDKTAFCRKRSSINCYFWIS